MKSTIIKIIGPFLLFALLMMAANNSRAQTISLPLSHQQLEEGVLLGSTHKLDPTLPPSGNFDLLDWSLTLPHCSAIVRNG